MLNLLKNFWSKIAKGIALVNSTILLTIFYSTILGIYAIAKKGYNVLKSDKQRKSSWLPYKNQPKHLKDVEQPF
jgi:hypothetical protein